MKIPRALIIILKIAIQLGSNYVIITIVELSWYMQNGNLIWSFKDSVFPAQDLDYKIITPICVPW